MGLKIELKKEDPKVLMLFLDDEFWREVSKSLFIKELKKIPQDLPLDEFMTQFFGLEEKVAKRYALYLLAKRSLLSAELESKLLDKGISPESADKTVQLCVEKGYLNDEAGIERLFARELKRGRSAKAAYFKLRQKGLKKAVLKHQYEHAMTSEREALQKWLDKNGRKIKRDDPREMRKWVGKLCRQGFSAEMAIRVLAAKEQ
jgi:SOS response regulatory protein OraA/RecX